MSDVEFFGRVAQKPAKVSEGLHPFFNGKRDRTPEQLKKNEVPTDLTYERFPIED